ncbi:hypothetical protein LTR37_014858 [Vermiconidia calcicola]|uniref:Uncharacterized protein n=1 Tax=Vermiconidia calcicola TaxID=1690605 RepID=A0ACC3MTI8_9PEZI|nr:hypothetical protein LTR37_014858 [Vermiconidia calcicola]
MTFPTAPMLVQAFRFYSHRVGQSKGSALGVGLIMGYCCVAFSAPFAGAAVVSRRASDSEDARYAKMRPLSFRDCLPGSRLEDYAGVFRR